MTRTTTSLIRWLDHWPTCPDAARGIPAAWLSSGILSCFRSPADAVRAIRHHETGSQVFAELVAREDETSTLAALAGIAPRLAAVRWHWRVSGTPETELDDLEADLVTECISLMRSQPELPPGVLVRSARHRVCGRRRTERARADRQKELHHDHTKGLPDAGISDTAVFLLLRRHEAKALWLWACGWKTHEAAALLGATPATVRAWQSRGIRALRSVRELVA